eukprot:CAMPEP_0170341854 /NCGR_PEP_ID=MMETSP0116_2-20130129/72064_1 /TAXON_ID=400756 /ORGANISM="Durinskia baltica, Strain CSIRO CS-38" /LENGTH=80 /DNA_ID=CAMNT_0010595431 /DNA_START=205 /DNA_END=443 /DNA_ORIENTATION=-
MPATFEQVGHDDIVRLVTRPLHVLDQGEGSVEVLTINHGFDQHRVCDLVRCGIAAGLHDPKKLEGLVNAVASDQTFDEGR